MNNGYQNEIDLVDLFHGKYLYELDNNSQKHIKNTIDDLVKDHTIVIIAHRLSTIMDADEIILLDEGKVKAIGTHEELLKNKIYKNLYSPELTEVE